MWRFLDKGMQWMLAVGLVLICVGSYAFLIWSGWRGIGMADAGLFTLAAYNPEDITLSYSFFHIYTHGLYLLAMHDLVLFRWLGVLLLLVSTLLLAFGISRYWRRMAPDQVPDRPLEIMGWALISLGGLVHYNLFNITPGSTLLLAILVALNSGLFFLSLASPAERYRWGDPFMVASGWGLGILLFINVPGGISLMGLTLVMIFLSAAPSPQRRRRWVSLLLGLFSYILVHFTLIQTLGEFTTILRRSIALYTSPDAVQLRHDPMLLLQIYFWTIVDLLKHLWRDMGLLLMIGWGIALGYRFLMGREKSEVARLLGVLLGVVGLILLFVSIGWHGHALEYSLGNWSRRGILWSWTWIFLLAGMALAMGGAVPVRSRLWSAPLFLLAAPMAVTMGTAESIVFTSVRYGSAWYALIVLLLWKIAAGRKISTTVAAGMVVIGAMISSQVVQSGLSDVEGADRGVLRMDTPVMVGDPPTQVLFRKDYVDILEAFQEKAYARGFQLGDDLMGFCTMSWIVIGMGGKPLGMPWYYLKSATQLSLDYVDPSRIRRAFIIQNYNYQTCMPELSRYGIRFPEDYDLLIEKVPGPGEPQNWYKLWAPKIQQR